MSKVVLLDSGPLGQLVHPSHSTEIKRWAESLARRGAILVLPEIVYYELRRELARIGSATSVDALDGLLDELLYAPVDRSILVRASELWAHTRSLGLPTADDAALDVDVILAATTERFLARGDEVVVATSNVRHLDRFVPALRWDEITP